MMRKVLLSALLILSLASERAAQADSLEFGLADYLVAITTGFAGSKVFVYGAVEERSDVVVVVRGPRQDITLYRKERIAGIWINTAWRNFERVPTFYAYAATQPLEEIASPIELRRNQLGLDYLRLDMQAALASANVLEEWRNGFKRNKVAQGLYATEPVKISFVGDRLFRAEIDLPPNVPVGTYTVITHVFRDDREVVSNSTSLYVSKIGLEAEIFDFAHNYSSLYGLVSIVVALFAGWLGHAVFRRT